MAHSTRWTTRAQNVARGVVGFLAGALVMGVISMMQAMIMGAESLHAAAYLVPISFGGAVGIVLAYCLSKPGILSEQKFGWKGSADNRLEASRPVRFADQHGAGNNLRAKTLDRESLWTDTREENAFLRSVLDSVTHPVYVINASDYTIELANSAAGFGDVIDEATCYALTHRTTHPCGTTEHPCPLEEVRRSKKPTLVQHTHYDREGNSRYVEIHASPIFDSDGNVAKVTEFVLDITDRVTAEKALQIIKKDFEKRVKERTEALERSNKELEEFAHMAAHDLREPLLSVASYLKLFSRLYSSRLDGEANKFLTRVIDVTVRMDDLIQDLLAYASQGNQQHQFGPTEAQAALETALENLRPLITESGTTVTSDALPVVTSDVFQLVQVFQNLLANAIKYRRDETPMIHVSVRQKPGEWEFSVRDNGMGIDERNFDKIFHMFHRLDSRAGHAGSGIGLASCRKIVERHGGRIWVESETGKGSTFMFTIPDQSATNAQT